MSITQLVNRRDEFNKITSSQRRFYDAQLNVLIVDDVEKGYRSIHNIALLFKVTDKVIRDRINRYKQEQV